MEKRKVIVFGASAGGRNYKEKQIDYEILAFVDNDKNKQGTTLERIPIIAPEYMEEYDYDYIVIASVFYKEIKHQLLNEMGIIPSEIKMAPKGLLKSSYRPFEDEETMKFARKSLLRVTKVFSENNIKYFADFGTLLGIVREGDLIPWDDDIDLSILMNDYDEVVSLFRSNIKDFEIDKDIECKVHVTHDRIRKEPINIGLSFVTNGNKVIRKFQINIGVVTIKDEFAVQSMNCSPKYHFEQQQQIDFWGEKISVPFEYESYLEFTYGDWKTPKMNTSFEDYPLAFKDTVVSFREIIC